MTWRPFNAWKPDPFHGHGQLLVVRCDVTGQVAIAKTESGAREALASAIARAVGLPVPVVELVMVAGHGDTFAASHIWHSSCIDVGRYRELVEGDQSALDGLAEGLRAASGLLALYTWIRTEDLKDESLLVRKRSGARCEVGAIDLAFSFAWRSADVETLAPANGPPELLRNVDRDVVEATLVAIETMPPGTLDSIVQSVGRGGHDDMDRRKLVENLLLRRGHLRRALREVDWLP